MKNKKNLIVLLFVSFFAMSQKVSAEDFDKAQYYLNKAKIEAVEEQRFDYLILARNHFLKALKDDPLNIDIMLALSESYKLTGDRYESKLYLLKVYNTNPSNPYFQRELADFYYYYQEYSTAIEYYKLALASGLLKDYDTNLKTAECYEKLGDEENTELYYKISFYLNPNSNKAKKKVNEFESIKKINEMKKEREPRYKYLFKEKQKKDKDKQKLDKEINKLIEEINSF